jgi:hypothetical protein
VQSRFDLARYRGRRLRLRFLVSTSEVQDGVTQQVLGWNSCCPLRYGADDGWYIDDIQVTNTLVSAASVVVDPADRSALPACGPVCGSVTASLIPTPSTTAGPDEVVTLDASGSAADQCPGGILHYRLWRDLYRNGTLEASEPGVTEGAPRRVDTVLQEWGPGTSVIDVPNGTMGYAVDVRCSTRPACTGGAAVVVPLVCDPVVAVPFPGSIAWTSQVRVEVGVEVGTPFDAIRGDLDALRASGGEFDGTVQTCIMQPFPPDGSFIDATVPGAGQAFYYLVRDPWNTPVCTFGSWGTGSPAEVPGAGGDRDADIALDPDTCPSPN